VRRGERRGHRGAVALLAYRLQARDLVVADRVVVDRQRLDRRFLVELVLVDADDRVEAGIDAGLLLRRARLDLQLGPAALHRLRHAAHRLDLLEDRPMRRRLICRVSVSIA
jgi:hypothetical protein